MCRLVVRSLVRALYAAVDARDDHTARQILTLIEASERNASIPCRCGDKRAD
jgi:hypothetical protein